MMIKQIKTRDLKLSDIPEFGARWFTQVGEYGDDDYVEDSTSIEFALSFDGDSFMGEEHTEYYELADKVKAMCRVSPGVMQCFGTTGLRLLLYMEQRRAKWGDKETISPFVRMIVQTLRGRLTSDRKALEVSDAGVIAGSTLVGKQVFDVSSLGEVTKLYVEQVGDDGESIYDKNMFASARVVDEVEAYHVGIQLGERMRDHLEGQIGILKDRHQNVERYLETNRERLAVIDDRGATNGDRPVPSLVSNEHDIETIFTYVVLKRGYLDDCLTQIKDMLYKMRYGAERMQGFQSSCIRTNIPVEAITGALIATIESGLMWHPSRGNPANDPDYAAIAAPFLRATDWS